jgi:hypothetical protein
MQSQSGPPMTLGSAAAAQVRLIVWCRGCGHQVEPDPAEMAARYGADMPVLDWRERLVCSRCGSRQVDIVLISSNSPRIAPAQKGERASMAFDDHKAEYHLTPRGWEPGDPPPDRAETWICHTEQQSFYSKEYVTWSCQWADPRMRRDDRDKLRAAHREFMGRAGRSGKRITTIGEPL